MKVLYISNYRDQSYTSSFAIDNILSLNAVGIDVVCRPVGFPDTQTQQCEDIDHYENKSLCDVDAVIQHVPPNFYERKSDVKNIGFLYWHQSLFDRSMMEQCCNLMDELWVPCTDTYDAAKKSGVTIPIFITKHGRDKNRFDNHYDAFKIPALQGKLVYYTIADLTRRKNISGLIRAYYAAFNKHDQVHLLLQFGCVNQQEINQTKQLIERIILDLKKATNIYPNPDDYPKISIMCDVFDNNKTCRVHATGDVFVSCDRGDPWNIFLHDAMGFGNPVICSSVCGQKELVATSGILIDGQDTPYLIAEGSEKDVNTGREFWFDPDLKQFKDALVDLYDEWEQQNPGPWQIRSNMCKQNACGYNYESVGSLMKKRLEGDD